MASLLLLAATGLSYEYDYCFGAAKPNEPVRVPKVPAGYSLKMAFVVTRHGARTPLRALPKLQPTWNCTESELAVLSTDAASDENVHLLFRKVAVSWAQTLPGNCFVGQLTALGAQQHASIGRGFRQAFIERDPLLKAALTPSQIYLRATDVPRVQQSAQSQLVNMFPDVFRKGGELRGAQIPTLPLHIVEFPKDNMIPTAKTCAYITKLVNDLYNTSEWKGAVSGISDVISALESTYGVKINPMSNDLEDFGDSFHVMDCHQISFPSAITPTLRGKLYTALNKLWHVRYSNHLLSSLSLGGFAEDMSHVFSRVGKQDTDPVFRLYSGHDTTLAPLAALFGIYDGTWPPLASQLIFQTLQDESKAWFVRAVYNGYVQKMPVCADELCPLSKFQSLVSSIQSQHASDVSKYCK